MRKVMTVVVLGLALAVSSLGAAAQEGAVINADGNSGASNAGLNPAVDADGPTIVYGDLYPGPGTTVIGDGGSDSSIAPGTTGSITAADGDAAALGPGSASAAPGTVNGSSPGASLLGPDGTYSVSDSPPSNVNVGDSGTFVAAPAPEEAVDTTATEPVVADTAVVGSEGDLDGDNYPDALELEVGLDPSNIDTDGDGVADGDEVNIYGTDPFIWDTDGDGVNDGAELFDTRTDPLVWEDHSGGATVAASAAETETLAAETAVTSGTEGDSDGDRLSDADETAIGTDPTIADTDGDGYYDGDEVILGADPFDPGSYPVV